MREAPGEILGLEEEQKALLEKMNEPDCFRSGSAASLTPAP
jgi:hypothetical protein